MKLLFITPSTNVTLPSILSTDSLGIGCEPVLLNSMSFNLYGYGKYFLPYHFIDGKFSVANDSHPSGEIL